jgi:hypothetical protein
MVREPTRASDPHRLEVQSDAVTAPATAPRVAQVLALQRTIGNRSVGRVLARWPLPAGAPAKPAAVDPVRDRGSTRARRRPELRAIRNDDVRPAATGVRRSPR